MRMKKNRILDKENRDNIDRQVYGSKTFKINMAKWDQHAIMEHVKV